jgi:hypothetical protein
VTRPESKAAWVWIYGIQTVCFWLRMDGAIPFVVFWAYGWLYSRSSRSWHLKMGAIFLGFSVLALTSFRLWYFHQWLPNPYYTKMTGFSLWERCYSGLQHLWDICDKTGLELVLLPLVTLLERKDRVTALLWSILGAQVLYGIYTGGDYVKFHWSGAHRFLVPALPVFFILAVQAIDIIWKKYIRVFPWLNRWKALLLLLCLVRFNAFGGAESLKAWCLMDRALYTNAMIRMTHLGLRLREITTPETNFTVTAAGALSYFSRRTTLDILGKNDAYLARVKPRKIEPFGMWPGHNKWDFAYSLGRLKPDIITGGWFQFDEAVPYISGQYEAVQLYLGDDLNGKWIYVRKGIKGFLWDKAAPNLVQVIENPSPIEPIPYD